ncbi:PIG-L family deacetylase [Niabella defluvii]|nr:PIG-L family deacetylase [Niabella sp. I65]
MIYKGFAARLFPLRLFRYFRKMKMRIISSVFLFFYISAAAQPGSASQVLQRIQKLKVLGSVLYVAAHPDDENTRLITYLANDRLYRTGYLSLTRGDGGQNLIGDEQGIELGLIRTQELLAARRIDGESNFSPGLSISGFQRIPKKPSRNGTVQKCSAMWFG